MRATCPMFLVHSVFSILYLMRRGNRRAALFPLTTWNVHDRVINDLPRTNKSVEG